HPRSWVAAESLVTRWLQIRSGLGAGLGLRSRGVYRSMTSVNAFGSIEVAVREVAVDGVGRERFALHFRVRINEEVEWRTGLSGQQLQISASAEFNPILGQIAEVIVGHFGILVGLGNINADPAAVGRTEFGPAVIAGNFACTALSG